MAELNQIVDIVNKFESLHQEYLSAAHDLEKKIADKEKLRSEYSADVEKDGTNPENRTKLLNIERDLNDNKKTLNKKQSEFSEKTKMLRGKFIEAQNLLISQAKTKLKNMEREKEALRSELIPETERRLTELNERKKKLDIEILNLITKLNELEKEGEQWLQKM